MRKVSSIVLAAGKGTRLNSKIINKVMLFLNGKPMIGHTVDLLKKLNTEPIIVVVGFKKKSIINFLKNKVLYAEQKTPLGTAHAVSCALKVLSRSKTSDVLIVNGDDSYFYPPSLLKKLIKIHLRKNSSLTLLTIEKEDPKGLGRILRDKKGKIVNIIEEKDADYFQKKIKEINPQCWVFKTSFLKEFLPKVKMSKVTKEYYLTNLVSLAVKHNKKIKTVKGGKIPWRGVNTKKEFKDAEKLLKNKNLKRLPKTFKY